MPQMLGSAAAMDYSTAPESADASIVERCAQRLARSAQLALIASRGPEPMCGAEYLLDTLDDLKSDLALLRRTLR